MKKVFSNSRNLEEIFHKSSKSGSLESELSEPSQIKGKKSPKKSAKVSPVNFSKDEE